MTTGLDYRNKLNGTAQDLASKLDELALVLFAGKYDPMGSGKVWTTDAVTSCSAHTDKITLDLGPKTATGGIAVDPDLLEAMKVLLGGLGTSKIKDAFKEVTDVITKVITEANSLKEELLGDRAKALKALNDPRDRNAAVAANRFGQWKEPGDNNNAGNDTNTRSFGFIPALAAFFGANTAGLSTAMQEVLDATASAEAYTVLVAYGNALLRRLGEVYPTT